MSRSGLYYEPTEVSAEDLSLMRLIDEQYLRTPFYGSRRMTVWLNQQGSEVNRKRIQRLMRLMGLEGLAPGPSTSTPHPEHAVYPYLLRGLDIRGANHVWATDISYIPLQTGFVYVMAIMDWYSRCVLSWRLSNTLDHVFCVEALEAAMDAYGHPEIFNSDQGAQFTCEEFTGVLKRSGIQISMDGKGRCHDNIFIERLWRSLKYEEVYLHAYDGMSEARTGIARWFRFYNTQRPHQALGNQTPLSAFTRSIAEQRKAA